MLSSMFPAEGSTKAVIPFVIFSLCLFAGLLISIDEIPNALFLFNYGSFFKYYYEGLIVNEFDRLNQCLNNICNVPKDEMSFTRLPRWSLLIMVGIVVFARMIGQCAFYLRLRSFYYDAEIERKIRKKHKIEEKEFNKKQAKERRLKKKKRDESRRETIGGNQG